MRHVSGRQIEIDEEIKIKMHRSKQTDSRSNSSSIIHDRVKRLMFDRCEEKNEITFRTIQYVPLEIFNDSHY